MSEKTLVVRFNEIAGPIVILLIVCAILAWFCEIMLEGKQETEKAECKGVYATSACFEVKLHEAMAKEEYQRKLEEIKKGAVVK